MEGEWERKYWDLVGAIALSEAEERRGQKALPHFFSLCSEKEKKMILQKCNNRIEDGQWIGNMTTRSRPMITIETAQTKELSLKRRREEKSRNVTDDRIKASIMVAHVTMWDVGKLPTGRKRVASHICHDGVCIDPTHIEWESHDDNNLREVCNKSKMCQCELNPPCNFLLHPERHVSISHNRNPRIPSKTSKTRHAGVGVKMK